MCPSIQSPTSIYLCQSVQLYIITKLKFLYFGHSWRELLPSDQKGLDVLPNALISSAEGVEDCVGKFTILVRARDLFPHYTSWWVTFQKKHFRAVAKTGLKFWWSGSLIWAIGYILILPANGINRMGTAISHCKLVNIKWFSKVRNYYRDKSISHVPNS